MIWRDWKNAIISARLWRPHVSVYPQWYMLYICVQTHPQTYKYTENSFFNGREYCWQCNISPENGGLGFHALSFGLPTSCLTLFWHRNVLHVHTKYLYQFRIWYSSSCWKHATWQIDLVLTQQNSFRLSLFP